MTSVQFTPDFHHTSAFPHEAAAASAMRARDWGGLRAVYDRALTWYDRELIMGAADLGSEEFYRSVLDRDPEDLVAASMYGSWLITTGWRIRTDKRANEVSPEQLRIFHEYLGRAEQLLAWVCAKDPTFVVAWIDRITIARGLGLGPVEARRRHDQVMRHDPHNMSAQQQMLEYLYPKWGGDYATALAFARECAAAAPPGYPNAVMVLDVHYFWWLSETADGNIAYFKTDPVRQELIDAGERSVLHPDFNRSRRWITPLNSFAWMFTLHSDWPRAKQCFLKLGPYAVDFGWDKLHKGSMAESFVYWRSVALEYG